MSGYRECGYPSEPPVIRTSGYADILAKRDMLLRELDALRNKVAGLNFAIDVVAEQTAASGMDARQDGNEVPSRSDDSPVGSEASETPNSSSNHSIEIEE